MDQQQHPFPDDIEEDEFDDDDDEDDDDEADHAIFNDIERGDFQAVQQRVLADAAVLEERESSVRMTPLMQAIISRKPAIALWLLGHRGQHNLDTADEIGWTALHRASTNGPLEVVQALVAAGANAAAVTRGGDTPLMLACTSGHTGIVAFLLQLPAVKASIDHMSQSWNTALSYASSRGQERIVQLLLDAGADPTIPAPAGQWSPHYKAWTNNHDAVAALLRHAIDAGDRAWALHKARILLGGGARALGCLQDRKWKRKALPRLELTPRQRQQQQQQLTLPGLQQLLQWWQRWQQQQEKLQATAAFAVGVSGGEKDTGLCEDLYLKLQEYMLPVWADKEPAAKREWWQ